MQTIVGIYNRCIGLFSEYLENGTARLTIRMMRGKRTGEILREETVPLVKLMPTLRQWAGHAKALGEQYRQPTGIAGWFKAVLKALRLIR